MKEQKKSPGLFDWLFFVGCCLVIYYWISGLVDNGFFKGFKPSEGLVRGLVYGAMIGLLVGAVAILKAIWRKYFRHN